MKKVVSLLMVICMVFAFAACGADNNAGVIVNDEAKNTNKISVEINNQTGKTLNELYVSADGEIWSENKLSEPLMDTNAVSVNHESEAKSKEWAIKVVTESGKTATWTHIALGELEVFSLGKISE